MNTQARSAPSLRLECSRIVLFGLLLMSAFLSSMVHVSPESAFESPAAANSSVPAAHATAHPMAHPASRR